MSKDDYIPYVENLEDILFVKIKKIFYYLLLIKKTLLKFLEDIQNIFYSDNKFNDKNNSFLSKINLVFQILLFFGLEITVFNVVFKFFLRTFNWT